MSGSQSSPGDEWEDLAMEAPLRSQRLGDCARSTPSAIRGADMAADLAKAAVRPLCLCANQKYNRIVVGHEKGFLVFHVQQDRAETFEEFAESTSGGKAGDAVQNCGRATKPSLSHLVLDPFYNTDAQTFSAIRRRMRTHERRLRKQQEAVEPANALPVGQEGTSLPRGRNNGEWSQSSAVDETRPLLRGTEQHVDPAGLPREANTGPLDRNPSPASPTQLSSAVDASASLRVYAEQVSDVMVSDDSMVSRAHRRRREGLALERTVGELPATGAVAGTGLGPAMETVTPSTGASSPYQSPFTVSELNRTTAEGIVAARGASLSAEASGAMEGGGEICGSSTAPEAAQPAAAGVFYESTESDKVDDEEGDENAPRLLGQENDTDARGGSLFASQVALSALNLFLSHAAAPSQRRVGALVTRPSPAHGVAPAKEHANAATDKTRAGAASLSVNAPEATVGNPSRPLPQSVAGQQAGLPEITWDDAEDSDDYEIESDGVGHVDEKGADDTGGNADEVDPRAFGVVPDAFLRGEDAIGFFGGGVGAAALQYEQSQVAVAGGGPTPMRRPRKCLEVSEALDKVSSATGGGRLHGCAAGAADGCEVFLLCNGCCRQVLTVADPVTKLVLDARVLFVLTRRELRLYTDPMDQHLTRCGFSVLLDGVGTSPLSPLPTPSPSIVTSQPLAVYPSCLVVDYTHSLFLVRGPHSATGFSLFRYATSLGPSPGLPADGSVGEGAATTAEPSLLPMLTGPTAAHVQCLVTLREAHANPLANFALHVGPALGNSSSSSSSAAAGSAVASAFGRASVYVAAASEYATRITLWQVRDTPVDDSIGSRLADGSAAAPGSGDGSFPTTATTASLQFVLLREFRVGFRLPSVAAPFLRWGGGRWSRDSLQANQQQHTPLAQPTGSSSFCSGDPSAPASHAPSFTAVEASATPSPATDTVMNSGLNARSTNGSLTEARREGGAGADAGTFAGISHLQFVHDGLFLFCVRGSTMSIFSVVEENAVDAKNVCQDHLKATQNKQSRLAPMQQLMKGFLETSFLSPYTRQAWASCSGRLPVHDAVFYPKWMLGTRRSAASPQSTSFPKEGDGDGGRGTERSAHTSSASPLATKPTTATAAAPEATAAVAQGVTGWLSRKLFRKGTAATAAPNATSASPTQTQSRPTVVAQEERPAVTATPSPSIAQCILVWEHDTPASLTTDNYHTYGSANMPSDAARYRGPKPVPSTAESSTDEGGDARSATRSATVNPKACVSIGPGGKLISKKVVLDCVTCDGTFVNVRLYTDSGKFLCSPAVPFELK